MTTPMPTTEELLDDFASTVVSNKFEQQALLQEITELGREARTAWMSLSTDYMDLYTLITNTHVLADARSAARLDKRGLKDEEPYFVAKRTAGLAKVEVSMLSWAPTPEGHDPDVHDADIAAMNELLAISKPAQVLITRFKELQNEIVDKQRSIAVMVGVDSRLLHGWYVTAKTNRRTAQGWVIGGRGKTIHILPDPFNAVRELPLFSNGSPRPPVTTEILTGQVKCYPERTDAGITVGHPLPEQSWYKWTTGQVTEIRQDKDSIMTFKMDTAIVTPLLPPELATDRRSAVFGVVNVFAKTWSTVQAAQQTYIDWAEGSKEIRRRQAAAKQALRDIEILDIWPESNERVYRTQIERILYGTLKERADVADALRAALIETALKSTGGELTESEQKILEAKPEGKNFAPLLATAAADDLSQYIDALAF